MSEPWFRMHANILDKPVTWRLAEATGIHPVKAAGHLAAFWGKVSQHGSHGCVGDLPDTQLEAWAGWDGRKGAFAAWLRVAHLTDGVVNEYDEYSGALEAHRAKNRERVKKWRTERERNAHSNDDVTRTESVTSASRNDVTIRDDTKREVTTPAARRTRGKPAPYMGRVNEVWRKHYPKGSPPPGTANILRPLFRDNPEDEVVGSLDRHLAETPAKYLNLAKWAATYGAVAETPVVPIHGAPKPSVLLPRTSSGEVEWA